LPARDAGRKPGGRLESLPHTDLMMMAGMFDPMRNRSFALLAVLVLCANAQAATPAD
jgi:hypothetical protein